MSKVHTVMSVLIFGILACISDLGKGFLLRNPDFETANLTGLTPWLAKGGKIAFNTLYAHGGKLTMKSYGRHNSTDGIGQYVTLTEGTRYKFSVYVKQFNDNAGSLMQTYTSSLTHTWNDNSRPTVQLIARQPYVRTATGWFLMDGSFMVPNKNISKTLLSVEGPEPGVDFLVDDFTLEEIPEDKNWEVEAYNRIRKFRRNKIHFIFTTEPHMNPADVTVKIDHKRHSFGFGAFVKLLHDTDPRYTSYHHFFASNFNWATVSPLYWTTSVTNHCFFSVYPTVNCVNGLTGDHQSHTTSVNYGYTTAIKMSLELKKNGIKMRGESLLGNPPAWIRKFQGATFEQNIQQRIQYMTNLTKGIIDQWDVLDNVLDDQTYEKQTGDPHYTRKIYQMMNHADPSVQIVMNEHDVVTGGYQTQAYTELANDLQQYGLNGIGAKTTVSVTTPDPTLLKNRLDRLASAGLPIWITDMSISEKDDNLRAAMLEKMLRLFFSHPSVEGVTYRGVWDRSNAPPYWSLFNGDNYKANAAGIRFQNLVRREWSTHVTRILSKGKEFTIDGYHGDYDINVFYKGRLITHKEIQLKKSDIIYQMHLKENATVVTSPTHTPPHVTTHGIVVDTFGQRPIGVARSKSNSRDLKCVSRQSAVSAATIGSTTKIGCPGDEVLTGCSSMKKADSGDLFHNGQTIVKSGNRTECQAINGGATNAGVIAEARCCTAKDFSCAYKGAGPSQKFNGALIKTNCPQNYDAVGCTGSQTASQINGNYPWLDGFSTNPGEETKRLVADTLLNPLPNAPECLAANGGSTYGAMSAAACCHSLGLMCMTVSSTPSDVKRGNETSVACQSQGGYVMTSCQARSKSGKIGGTTIKHDIVKGDLCVAVNGADKKPEEEGVIAIAVCCLVRHSMPVLPGE